MRKTIIICDYCGKETDDVRALIPAFEFEGEWEKDCRFVWYDMCPECQRNIMKAISPEELRRREPAAGVDPEEVSAPP